MSQRHQTHRVPATITLSEGRSIEGDIHLQPLTLMHAGLVWSPGPLRCCPPFSAAFSV